MTVAFQPTAEWQPVPDEATLPPGCEIRMSMSTGKSEARLRPAVVVEEPRAVGLKRLWAWLFGA